VKGWLNLDAGVMDSAALEDRTMEIADEILYAISEILTGLTLKRRRR
jgi:hypothetical protein